MSGVRFARSLDRGPKRRLLRLVQSALPIRFVAFYMVDAPSQLGAVLALARLFLAKKMRQRIVMASSLLADPQAAADAGASTDRGAGKSGPQPSPRQTEMDAVARLLGQESLPAEFGGTLDSGALSLSWWEQQQQQQQQQQQAGGRPIIAAATELGMLVTA